MFSWGFRDLERCTSLFGMHAYLTKLGLFYLILNFFSFSSLGCVIDVYDYFYVMGVTYNRLFSGL